MHTYVSYVNVDGNLNVRFAARWKTLNYWCCTETSHHLNLIYKINDCRYPKTDKVSQQSRAAATVQRSQRQKASETVPQNIWSHSSCFALLSPRFLPNSNTCDGVMKRKIGLVSDEGLGDVWEGSEKRNPPLNGSGSETDRCRGRGWNQKWLHLWGLLQSFKSTLLGR